MNDMTLDAAWAEAEAALPEGWHLRLEPGIAYDNDVRVYPPDIGYAAIAEAVPHPLGWSNGYFMHSGPTPSSALRALVVDLEQRAESWSAA